MEKEVISNEDHESSLQIPIKTWNCVLPGVKYLLVDDANISL